MTSNLDHLEALFRQAEIDSRDKRSRLKIIGSLPQTRLLKALYANAESLIVGCKAVEGVVEQQEQLRAAINQIIDDVDDFAPISVVATLMDLGVDLGDRHRVLLPACGSCNSIAEDQLFKTVAAKRRYVQKRLFARYKRMLHTPRWADDEIEDLGFSLKDFITKTQRRKDRIWARIRWRNSRLVLDAKTAASPRPRRAHGLASAQPHAETTFIWHVERGP